MSPLVVLSVLVTLITTCYLYVKYVFGYWKRKGVPFAQPSMPFGNFMQTFSHSRTIGQNIFDLYNSTTEPVIGLYLTLRPALLIRDPKVIRDILIKDFQEHFWHRGFHYDESVDPMTKNLFSQSGPEWKKMRALLSPGFTTGKIKAMFGTIVDCGSTLEQCIMRFASSGQEVEVNEIFAQFTTNVIASVAFGIEVDCLKDPQNEFRTFGRRIFDPLIRNTNRLAMSYLSPFLTKLIGVRFTDKDVTDFMIATIRETLEYREKNNIFRKDFLQLLIQLRNTGKVQDDGDWATKTNESEKLLSIEEIAAQAYLFFIAGYESSSTTMSFCMYELAKNRDVQRKLCQEIDNVLQQHNGEITYESLSQMHYLDCCIDETIRMHPAFEFFSRECTKDYEISDTGMIIEKGTPIMFSVTGSQYDADYYDQPYTFNPDRFKNDQTANKNSPYMPYIAFGDGPRTCIGMRLGKTQAKVGICLLLRTFSFSLGEQHVNKELEFSTKSLSRTSKSGIKLKASVRQ